MNISVRPETIRQHLVRTGKVRNIDQPDVARIETKLAPRPPLSQPQLTGFEDEKTKTLLTAKHHLQRAGAPSLCALLPLMLQLKGKPYTLHRHFPFEPFFRTRMPEMTLLLTGRQVSKSTSLAAQGVLLHSSIPYLSTLYVTPLFEQIRRFSQNYMRLFIETSPLKRLLRGTKASANVLNRSFTNHSQMIFSFAFLDAERTRGVSADRNVIDEIQGLNVDFLSSRHETLSGSEQWGLIQYAGTPKGRANTAEHLWTDSSQAEWVIPCRHGGCNYFNIPRLEYDLLQMIGPLRDDISEDRPGLTCRKCTKLINPRHGRWVHKYRDRRWTFAGYHVPQQIMPMHYGSYKHWALIRGKMEGRRNTPFNVFMNEVCGESSDVGAALVTETDLRRAACLPWANDANEAVKHIDDYVQRVCAVDWGGGGENLTSFTVVTVLGLRPDGKIDVLWAHRVTRLLDYEFEARLIIAAIRHFRCSHFAHDFGTSGGGREVLVRQSGFPLANIVPIRYVTQGIQNFMVFKPATERHPRDWYAVDRSRSLMTVCMAVRTGLIRFFAYDHISKEEPGLLYDFVALEEDTVERRFASNAYAIIRNPSLPDDFAHAVTYGCCALWHMSGDWPHFAEALKFEMPIDVLEHVHPTGFPDWDALSGR